MKKTERVSGSSGKWVAKIRFPNYIVKSIFSLGHTFPDGATDRAVNGAGNQDFLSFGKFIFPNLKENTTGSHIDCP